MTDEPPTSDVAFSPAVKALQSRMGSRPAFAALEAEGGFRREIDDGLAAFLTVRDSFYFATASAAGQPYVQHRGGPVGFLKVIDSQTLAFADFAGNRQYISAGNLGENDQVMLFLIDYPRRQRIKIWGRAEVVEDDAELLAALADAAYKGRPERAIRIRVAAWDVNCPRHITRRVSESELGPVVQPLLDKIAGLEAELGELRRRHGEIS